MVTIGVCLVVVYYELNKVLEGLKGGMLSKLFVVGLTIKNYI